MISHRVNAGVFLPDTPKQADDFILPELLHTAVAHGVGDVLELGNRLAVINRLVHLAAPVEQYLHYLPVQIAPATGELAHFTFD